MISGVSAMADSPFLLVLGHGVYHAVSPKHFSLYLLSFAVGSIEDSGNLKCSAEC
jgi:hypothetical protein